MIAPIAHEPGTTLPIVMDRLARTFGTAPALLSEQQCLTYAELGERVNRYALWALRHKISRGDVVCLLMANCPDYFAIWLGITKVGGIVSLINTHLSGESLARSINTVAAKYIIVGADLADRLAAVLPYLVGELKVWTSGPNNYEFARIDSEISELDGKALAGREYRRPILADRALYIHTSGSSGLPKAANVSHFRLMQWSYWFAGMMDTQPDDRMYNCLPMYHSAGGILAIGAILVNGGSVVLREGFSATRFWDDMVDWNCTIFQYIGELCRYLVNSGPHPRELQHRLRLCCGNGLRAGVWDELKHRFHIPRILEFYAATESTFSLFNCDGKSGAVGRIPAFLSHRFPMALVRSDVDTGDPLRDTDGFCIRCLPDEAGEAIGPIVMDGSSPIGKFEGYSDELASAEKLLRNVFAPGDVWYRTGDLMRRDGQGFIYFVDRIGDTFRWKGENVSTGELEDIISTYRGVTQVAVYGVTIPNTEGRAGMVAAMVSDEFDLAGFQAHLTKHLPEFARPLFLRIADRLAATTTFKLMKRQLSLDGYDPAVITDPIYFNAPDGSGFVRLDRPLYERICAGEVRL
jgi:fatty-acyl-CoA synthase